MNVIDQIHCLKYFTSELVIRSYFENFRIIEVPVTHFKRKQGSTNVFPIRGIPCVVIEELIGLLKLKRELGSKK